KLIVASVGPRTVSKANDPYIGPDVRITQISDGAGVGFVHFETIVGAGIGALAAAQGENGGLVRVFDAATRQLRFALDPYPGFAGGVTVAMGDVNGDGIPDIITGTATASSHVKAFDGIDATPLLSFLAFPGFGGGVSVAVGDTDCDGHSDIIV